MTDAGRNADGSIDLRGCRFPQHLHYDVANHIWYEQLDTGDIRVGMTCVAAALADNRIFAFTPRRVGREFTARTSIATIESSKWVGPVRIAFDGIITAVHDELSANPGRLAEDPYGDGWMIVARPNAQDVLESLVTGEQVGAAYLDWMNANDFPGCAPEAS